MTYAIECRCGRRIGVSASAAGAEVSCACGAVLAVPKLSVLRERSGQGAYESGPIDTIHRMLAEGTLPWGTACAVSGLPTDDVIHLTVECERLHAGSDNLKIALLISPLLFFLARYRERDAVGRDTVVWTPLRVCREHHRSVAKARQRTLRRLLGSVPIYQRLLKEYPRPRIIVGKPPTGDGMRAGSLAPDS
jgi:hypothetical protein